MRFIVDHIQSSIQTCYIVSVYIVLHCGTSRTDRFSLVGCNQHDSDDVPAPSCGALLLSATILVVWTLGNNIDLGHYLPSDPLGSASSLGKGALF